MNLYGLAVRRNPARWFLMGAFRLVLPGSSPDSPSLCPAARTGAGILSRDMSSDSDDTARFLIHRGGTVFAPTRQVSCRRPTVVSAGRAPFHAKPQYSGRLPHYDKQKCPVNARVQFSTPDRPPPGNHIRLNRLSFDPQLHALHPSRATVRGDSCGNPTGSTAQTKPIVNTVNDGTTMADRSHQAIAMIPLSGGTIVVKVRGGSTLQGMGWTGMVGPAHRSSDRAHLCSLMIHLLYQ